LLTSAMMLLDAEIARPRSPAPDWAAAAGHEGC
jgi:hypothetical protein